VKERLDQNDPPRNEVLPRLKVTHFQRRPMNDQISIERLFEEIRRALPRSIDCQVRICPVLAWEFGRGG
jgi:hypothetical protein